MDIICITRKKRIFEISKDIRDRKGLNRLTQNINRQGFQHGNTHTITVNPNNRSTSNQSHIMMDPDQFERQMNAQRLTPTKPRPNQQ